MLIFLGNQEVTSPPTPVDLYWFDYWFDYWISWKSLTALWDLKVSCALPICFNKNAQWGFFRGGRLSHILPETSPPPPLSIVFFSLHHWKLYKISKRTRIDNNKLWRTKVLLPIMSTRVETLWVDTDFRSLLFISCIYTYFW